MAKLLDVSVRTMAAGVMVSIFGVVMVRGAPRAQAATTALIALFSCLSATVASALLPWWWLQAPAFLVVIFAAVYGRRFGPRWAAAGMASYITYLLVCFVRTPVSQVPNQWLGVVTGAGVAHLWRAVLLPDRPERVLVGAARAMELQVGLLIADVERALRQRQWTRRIRRRVAISHEVLLQDIAVIEQQLGMLRLDDHGTEAAWELRRRVFLLDFAAEGFSRSARREFPAGADTEVLRTTEVLKRAFLTNQDRSQLEIPGQTANPDSLMAAISRLASVRPLGPAAQVLVAKTAHAKGTPQKSSAAGPQKAAPQTGAPRGPALRQAVQTAAACGLAMLGGVVLSPQRWLWAVIAAYVVFAGVKSSEQVLVKSLQRTVGTVTGVLAGICLATLVSDHHLLAISMITVFVFLTFYSFQASYTAMIFWLTLCLALLYGLLGYFKPALLLLRLEETVVGSVAGAAVSLFLFRTPAHQGVWSACRKFMETLGELVATASSVASGKDRLSKVRDLDLAFEAVRDATRPNAGFLGPPTGRGVKAVLEALADCRYSAQALVWAPQSDRQDPATLSAAQEVANLLRRTIPKVSDETPGPALSTSGSRNPARPVLTPEPEPLRALHELQCALLHFEALVPNPSPTTRTPPPISAAAT